MKRYRFPSLWHGITLVSDMNERLGFAPGMDFGAVKHGKQKTIGYWKAGIFQGSRESYRGGNIHTMCLWRDIHRDSRRRRKQEA